MRWAARQRQIAKALPDFIPGNLACRVIDQTSCPHRCGTDGGIQLVTGRQDIHGRPADEHLLRLVRRMDMHAGFGQVGNRPFKGGADRGGERMPFCYG